MPLGCNPYGTYEFLVNYAWSPAAVIVIQSGMMVKTGVSNER